MIIEDQDFTFMDVHKRQTKPYERKYRYTYEYLYLERERGRYGEMQTTLTDKPLRIMFVFIYLQRK